MSSLFLVYKSGAGSGKTYTLTREFLKLALQSGKPWGYKQILAVTFTKKAANEMKSRILDWLYEFSISENIAANPKAQEILKSAEFDADELKLRAIKMHEHILHHYSDFSVQTIDSFVHKLIKSFYRDLKLSSDFEVNMDLDDAINEVVSSQLREVGTNPELTTTLQDFLRSKVEDEKSTRLSTELNEFFKTAESEKAKDALSKMSAQTFQDFTEVRKNISKKTKALGESIKKDQAELDLLLNKLEGTVHHLKNWSKKPFSDFIKYSKTPLTQLEKDTVFTAKFQNNGGEYDVVNARSLAIIENLIPVLDEYILLSSLQKNIYALSLVQDFKVRFATLKQEENMVMISDFNQMIYDVVKNNPAPFIYERLGERYHHYLIDEFQDTSLTQWSNFLPLISHCLASGRTTMIVGDSKQAIYRWRNGDFNLFANLPKLSNPENFSFISEVEQQLVSSQRIENLGHNFRSSSEVVEFNNRLFSAFKNDLSETGQKMYNDFDQKVTKAQDGYAQVKLFIEEDKDEQIENWLQHILDIIKDASENRNFNLGDIAILSRKNATSAQIADYLMENGVSTSSQEGLLLIHNRDVSLIMHTLRACVFPENESNSTQLFSILESKLGRVPDVLNDEAFLESYTIGKRSFSKLKIWNYLETRVGTIPEHQTWSRMSAFEAITTIKKYLKLEDTANDYLETLLEVSFLAERAGHKTIREFLNHWDQKHQRAGKGFSIASPEDHSSVKLMTIHASKGLEFPVVIFAEPFSRGLTSKLWYDLSGTSSPLETNYDTSIFKEPQGASYPQLHAQLDQENSEKFIDELNLFYVATTRAGQNLFICGKKANNALTKGDLFYSRFETEFGVSIENGEVFSLGTKQDKRLSKEEKPAILIKEIEVTQQSYDWKKRLSYRFSQSPLKEDLASISERSLGVSVHASLARLEKVVGIPEIHQTVKDQIEDEDILTGIKSLEGNSNWQNWFLNPLKVWNERSLINEKGDELIPDRVMEFDSEITVVDYKTGGKNEKYASQVKNYQALLSSLFEKPVKGYLVYLRLGEVEEVSS